MERVYGHGGIAPLNRLPARTSSLYPPPLPRWQNLQPILDDEIRAIVDKLVVGAQLTFIADCCHSGGLLDHDGVVINGMFACVACVH